MIEAFNVTKRYGSFLALDGITCQVGAGEVCGFLGLNGAGKTTFIRLLSCYMPPSSGRIAVEGFDTVRQSEEVRRRIGYLPERVPLYDDMRVDEYLRFRARLKGVRARDAKAAVGRAIDRCGLGAKSRSVIATLSKGYRQRVGLADALVHEPRILILDEPTSGLDPDQRREVRDLIQGLTEERTVFLSTHILPEAEIVCTRVMVIHQGVLRASDRLEDLRRRHGSVRVVHAGPPLASYGEGVALADSGAAADTTRLVAEDEASASRAVAAAVLAGRAVKEMVRERADLESIFIALTVGRGES